MYYKLNLEDIVISEEKQQEMRKADYAYKGKKTIVYNDNEQFRIYPKNNNLAAGNYGSVYSFIHNKKLNPHQSQCNGVFYNINDNTISAQRIVLETFASNSNSDNLQPLIIGDNKNDTIYDPAHNKVTLAWSHFGQDPKSFNNETEFSKEQQEIIKKSDYTTGKKTIVYDDNEQFKVYPKNNNFVIGNRATIYNLSKGKKAAYNLDKDGYERCYLGKSPVGVHRAIMETFNPVDNMENLQVNHIDCNKQNNIYQPEHGKVNLEWSTPKENVAHAIVMNHRFPSGGNHHKAIYKEEDIWKICKLMAKGYTGRQIAEELKIEYTPQLQDLTTKIRKKESWKNISDKFPEIQPRYIWNKNK